MLSFSGGSLPFEMDSSINFDTAGTADYAALSDLILASTTTLTDSSTLQVAAAGFRACPGTNRVAYCCGAFDCTFNTFCAEDETPSCGTVNGTPGSSNPDSVRLQIWKNRVRKAISRLSLILTAFT